MLAQRALFRDVAEDWLGRYPLLNTLRTSTQENHRSFTEHHLVPFFGTMPVTAIRTATVEDFITLKLSPEGSLRFPGKPLSMPSLRTGLMALRLILQHAVIRRHIEANPMDMLRLKRRREVEDTEGIDPFTPAELQGIMAAAERQGQDLPALIQLWAQTGARAGEVCGLQWHDLDLERGTLLIRRTWSRGRIGPTKTGLSRTVALTHPVLDETLDWRPSATSGSQTILTRLRQLSVRPMDPEAFVFGVTRPLPSWQLHREWRRVLALARVRYRPPEQLRHTFASTMLSRNAPLLYVQKQGGWRSAAVLLRVYARWMPQEHPTAPQEHPAPGRQPLTMQI
jgi:integrase